MLFVARALGNDKAQLEDFHPAMEPPLPKTSEEAARLMDQFVFVSGSKYKTWPEEKSKPDKHI